MNKSYEVKDIHLAPKGQVQIEWVGNWMPVLIDTVQGNRLPPQ